MAPMFSERAKRDISLEERIQECVTRSENGTPLPRGGPEMTALLSYFEWLTRWNRAGAFTQRGDAYTLRKITDI